MDFKHIMQEVADMTRSTLTIG